MMKPAPGPTTRSSRGTSERSPTASRSLGLNADSMAWTASSSSFRATRSNRSTVGNTPGMMRKAAVQWTRRTAIGLSGDGVSDTTGTSGGVGRNSGKVAATFAVEIGTNQKEARDAAQHQVDGRLSVEQRGGVRLLNPLGGGRSGQQDLQRFVDAEDMRQPLERVRRERRRRRLLPPEERRARREAEQRHLLLRVEPPLAGDVVEGRKTSPGECGRIDWLEMQGWSAQNHTAAVDDSAGTIVPIGTIRKDGDQTVLQHRSHDPFVSVDCREELIDGDELVIAVCDVDRAGPEEKCSSPVRERGNVGGKRGYRRLEPFDDAKANRRHHRTPLERSAAVRPALDDRTHLLGGRHEPDHQPRFGPGSNDVVRHAARE